MGTARANRAGGFIAPFIATLLVALSLVFVGSSTTSASATENNCQTNDEGWVKAEGPGTSADGAVGTVSGSFGSLSWKGTGDDSVKTKVDYTLKPGFTLELCVKAGQNDYYSPVITNPIDGQVQTKAYDSNPKHGISHISYRVRVVIPARPSVTDPCGAGNATWNVPADTAAIDWRLSNGHLSAHAITYPFSDGTQVKDFGRVVDSGALCPITVDVTFTDNQCVGTTYVPPTMDAPSYPGTSRSVDGAVAPGSTVTVTYTATGGNTILGQSRFTHAYPAQPSSAAYCDRPADREVADAQTACDLSRYGDFAAGTIRRTGVREHVWNANQGQWVLEPESGISWGPWTQADADRFTDEQYRTLCAPERPAPVEIEQDKQGCDLSGQGDFHPGVIRRSGLRDHVWNLESRTWELEPYRDVEWGPWTQAEDDVWSDREYYDNCAPDQPHAKRVQDSLEGCELSEYGEFAAGVIRRTGAQEYVWNLEERTWELEEESGIAWNAWTQAEDDVWSDREYYDNCAPDQPHAKRVQDSLEGCELSEYGEFAAGVIRRTGAQEYVWNLEERTWELEDESGIAWNAWTQSDHDVWDEDEYFAECAPEKPKDEPRTQELPGCDLEQYGDFAPGVIVRHGVQAYLWNSQTQEWELGQVAWGRWAQDSSYSDGEYFELCAPDQPDAEPLEESLPGCDLSQYGEFAPGVIGRTGTQPYVWDYPQREWVLGEEMWNDWTQTSVYDDQEYFENCAPAQPEPEPISETAGGCDLSQYGDFEPGRIDRTGTQPYVWDYPQRAWVLGEKEWGPWTQTSELSDEEYFDRCAEGQPEPIVREVAGAQADCDLGGVTTYVDVFTTDYVWDDETRTWVLGEETGPVRTDEKFVAYTEEQIEENCTEVKGEEKDKAPKQPTTIEVRGEQTAVPTQVDAGDGGAEAVLGAVHRNPLWLLAVGGGLGLMVLAGSRRRKVADR